MSQQQQSKVMQVNIEKFSDSEIPKIEKNGLDGYMKFGLNNDYPNYLINLYNKSSKNNAIINGKVTYIFGNGFENKIMANPSEDWNELSKMLVLDIEIFGGCYLQCIPKYGGGFNYFHINYENVRTNESNSMFYYSKDFKKTYDNPIKEFPAFNKNKNVTSILYFKEYRAGCLTYALPSWVAACNYIESDVEVSKATLTNAERGFSATKMISLFNGEPDSYEKKYEIVKGFDATYGGAEGRKTIVTFNDDPNKAPKIEDLGTSDLTKEDFTAVDNLITSNIFSGHNVTHPLLFGIQQEGKLGNATELKIAYDIFKNTYINAKQQQFEKLVTYLTGIEMKLKDVEPVGLMLNPADFKDVLPKQWVYEKFGIDETLYPENSTPATTQQTTQTMVNDVLTNLTGRQHQQIARIVRQFSQGKLTQTQASIMLKNGFGFTDADVNDYLGIESNTQQFSQDFNEDETAAIFESFGTHREQFELIESQSYSEFEKSQSEKFGVLDKIRNLLKPKIKIMFSYEKRPEASGPSVIPTTRPFCRKLVALDRFYSEEDIAKISSMVGYNVFKRCGGFWTHNGQHDIQCRHEWRANKVTVK